MLLSQGPFIEADVASAATCDIGATPTLKVRITGAIPITSFGPAKDLIRIGRFAGALTLTNGPTLVVPGGTRTTAAGDTFIAVSDHSATPIWTIVSYQRTTAGQVVFPAIQNPSSDVSTLDDYKEGSFTPTFTAATPPTGVTYSQQVGRYTKIGNVVFYYVFIALTSKGSGGSGAMSIAGLPYTCNASINPASNTRLSFVTLSAGYSWAAGLVIASTSTVFIQEQGSNVITQSVQWAAIGNTASFILSGSYFV